MEQIIEWFTQYGYWILFIGLFLEFLFLPFPGGTVMTVSGILAQQGELDYKLSIFLATLGTSLGMIATYFIGRRVGWPFFEKFGHRMFMGERRRKAAHKWFERFGSKVVFISFFVPGLRHFTGYISGLMKLRFRKFLIYMVSGALLWVVTFVSLGYYFGMRWKEILELTKVFTIPIIVLSLCLTGFFIYRKYQTRKKR